MNERISIVVTSIFKPNDALRVLADGARRNGWEFIVVGDVKSPPDFFIEGATFYDVQAQMNFDLKLAPLCPKNHYTRKNLGYLLAMKHGSSIIIETDDDNTPKSSFWHPRTKDIDAAVVVGKGWYNVYSLYSDKNIWPRGLPLEYILQPSDIRIEDRPVEFCPIQQGLADGNPDVDAVYRMTQQLPIDFLPREKAIKLSEGLWCPFNSQNTTWHRDAFALLYLPSFCTFRMTDIWRSFVAQRILWECGWKLTFHNATVYQDRNEHNLLRDFEQEVSGYLQNDKIKNLLQAVKLMPGPEHIHDNLRACYQSLITAGIITSEKEMELLDAWLEDVSVLNR